MQECTWVVKTVLNKVLLHLHANNKFPDKILS